MKSVYDARLGIINSREELKPQKRSTVELKERCVKLRNGNINLFSKRCNKAFADLYNSYSHALFLFFYSYNVIPMRFDRLIRLKIEALVIIVE